MTSQPKCDICNRQFERYDENLVFFDWSALVKDSGVYAHDEIGDCVLCRECYSKIKTMLKGDD